MNWFINMFREAALPQIDIEILRHTLIQTMDGKILRSCNVDGIIKTMKALYIPVVWELRKVTSLLDVVDRGAYNPSKELSSEIKQQVWIGIKKGLEKFSNEKEIVLYLKENVPSFKKDDSIKVWNK